MRIVLCSIKKYITAVMALILLVFAAQVSAQFRFEDAPGSQPTVNAAPSSAPVSSFREMQAMREELQALRGMIEEQNFKIRQLEQRLNSSQQQVSDLRNQFDSSPQPTPTSQALVATQNYPNPAAQTTAPNGQSGVIPLPSSAVQASVPVNANQPSGANVAYGVPTQTIDTSGALPRTSQDSNAPSYPPVSEISVGGSVIALPSAAPESEGLGQSPAVETIPAQTAPTAPTTAPVQQAAPTPIASIDEEAFYQKGFDLLKTADYEKATESFTQQLQAYPSGEYADDAVYWLGETAYINRDLVESKKHFSQILKSFPNSPRLPDAKLKVAYIEQDQGNDIEARILLQEIVQYHPKSNAAIAAKNRLAE